MLYLVLTDDPKGPQYSANWAYARWETLFVYQTQFCGKNYADVDEMLAQLGYGLEDRAALARLRQAEVLHNPSAPMPQDLPEGIRRMALVVLDRLHQALDCLADPLYLLDFEAQARAVFSRLEDYLRFEALYDEKPRMDCESFLRNLPYSEALCQNLVQYYKDICIHSTPCFRTPTQRERNKFGG